MGLLLCRACWPNFTSCCQKGGGRIWGWLLEGLPHAVPWAHPDSVFLFSRDGPAGLAEDGLPGAGCQADPGLRAADHSRGGGPALEGAR